MGADKLEIPAADPPSFVFEVDWVTPEERTEILSSMQVARRQTMNLRLMPSARLLRARARDDGNRIVGWAGFDAHFTPGMGEVFSLYVVPSYRTYLVGLVLETVRCAALKKLGVERVLCRMDARTTFSLLRYRLASKLMIEAARDEVLPEALALCEKCELYGRECASQAYVWVDIDQYLTRGTQRLGFELDPEALPVVLELDPALSKDEPPASSHWTGSYRRREADRQDEPPSKTGGSR
jgi:hypothetical protein